VIFATLQGSSKFEEILVIDDVSEIQQSSWVSFEPVVFEGLFMDEMIA
jgi:hypothetical protein